METQDVKDTKKDAKSAKTTLGARKVKRVKFYQAIEWESAQLTYIRPDMSKSGDVRVAGSKNISITPTPNGVLLESDKDCVEVFHANIAYISYEK